ncbi:MAG: alpha/beta fold hydrolase [Thermoanaerobaculia bacterium]
MSTTRIALACLILTSLLARAVLAASWPEPIEGDYVIQDFEFESGETLSEVRLHYTTLGTLRHDANGRATNAVLILHGTTGHGQGFLSENFAGQLFGPGQLLDAQRYYLVLTDAIGHGKSSRPSDGLAMRFPKYNYGDMVRAQYRLLTEHLGVDHLRLVMGTSMGGMQTWVWGYTYPGFMEALMPLPSLPVEIAGRNRMMRKMIIDSIMLDPAWNGGEYDEPPYGLTAAAHMLVMMVSSPLYWQQVAPTREEAEAYLAARLERYVGGLEANDMIYQFDSSRDYNPSPHLERIEAPLLAINSADDQVNPPELGILEREIQRVPHGRAIVLPITEETRGHGTHSLPVIWGAYLEELLEPSAASP